MDTNKAKTNARRLEAFLKSKGINLPYSACLEAIAHSEGVANWQTLEAQRPVISVSTEHLTGQPAANFFELPFLHPSSEWPLVEKVLIAYSLEDEGRGLRYFQDVHQIDEDIFEILAREARGEALDEDDLETLEGAAEEITLDWGDEYEGEGLTVAELRSIKQISDTAWQLADGRTVELFASGKICVPMAKAKAKRK